MNKTSSHFFGHLRPDTKSLFSGTSDISLMTTLNPTVVAVKNYRFKNMKESRFNKYLS